MLYVSSTLMWAYPVEAAILIGRQYGFAGMEVWAEHVWFHSSDTQQIRDAARRTGCRLTLHAASWDLNLCSLNQGIREQSIQEVRRSFDVAKAIGAGSVTIHPGRVTLSAKTRGWHEPVLIDSLNRLAREANERGLTLSIEHIEPLPKEMVVTPEELNRLRAALDYPTTATFDIAHVPLSHSLTEFYYEMENIDKIHISDATPDKLHVPLGTGCIDLEAIWELLWEKERPVILEGWDDSRELSVLKKNLLYLEQSHCVSF